MTEVLCSQWVKVLVANSVGRWLERGIYEDIERILTDPRRGKSAGTMRYVEIDEPAA